MAPGCLSCHSFISSATFQSLRLLKSCPRGFILETTRDSKGKKRRRNKKNGAWEREKKYERFSTSCTLTCREPQLHPDRESHGLWWLKRCQLETGHLKTESEISVGISLPPIGSVCSDKTKDWATSPKKTPTHSNTHQDLPSHLLSPIQPWWKATRGSSILADQTNTAAAFRPGRQGGCGAQRERTGDWLKNDNRYSTAAQRSHFLFCFSFSLCSLPH